METIVERAAGLDVHKAQVTACVRVPDQAGQRYAPNITGQSYEYVLKQLRGFKSQTRGDLDGTMTSAAQPLTDADIEVLARYLAALPPATRP